MKKIFGIKGICPKCFLEKELINHALFPQKYFAKNDYFLYLCRDCSQDLTNILNKVGKINETIYFKTQKAFIRFGNSSLPICLDGGQIGTKLRGVYPRCFEPRFLEKHHIFPKRFFKDSTERLFLCYKHHRKIEELIPRFHKLNKKIYIDLHKAFIRGVEIPIEIQLILNREKMEINYKKLSN